MKMSELDEKIESLIIEDMIRDADIEAKANLTPLALETYKGLPDDYRLITTEIFSLMSKNKQLRDIYYQRHNLITEILKAGTKFLDSRSIAAFSIIHLFLREKDPRIDQENKDETANYIKEFTKLIVSENGYVLFILATQIINTAVEMGIDLVSAGL